jgi:aspartate-semialdehyde dehydrogenase
MLPTIFQQHIFEKLEKEINKIFSILEISSICVAIPTLRDKMSEAILYLSADRFAP